MKNLIYSPLICLPNIVIFTFVFMYCTTINAQWSEDPTVNNAICVTSGAQSNPKIVGDGAGGAIITWEDTRGGSYDIYAQKISSGGVVQWSPSTGVVISVASDNQGNPTIVSDGAGGAIIAWQDLRWGNYDVYAQKIDPLGNVQWTSDGVLICNATGNQIKPTIVSDDSGGAIITWEDYRGGSNYDVYSQRINTNGAVQWTANGEVICNTTNNSQLPTIVSVSDGIGGAIITWIDLRNLNTTSYDLYAQRINSAGVIKWAANGVAICTGDNFQDYPTIVSDGSRGAIITWQDERDIAGLTKNNIYAQRVDSSGNVRWTQDGWIICDNDGNQYTPTIVSDDLGGAIITWQDFRNSNNDIYAQRILSNGLVAWTANGVPICTETADQQSPIIIYTGTAAIIVWKDDRNSNWDIYAQKINLSGSLQWTFNGGAISTATGTQEFPAMVIGGIEAAIITWQDLRNSNYDIYAYGVTASSPLPVELVSFTAQTGNGIVELNWQTATEVNNYGFEIERQILNQVQNDNWEKIGFVAGHGNSNSPKDYSFIDNPASDGKYPARSGQVFYRLKQIDNDGKFEYSKEVEVDLGMPNEFSLSQNYPNPFNPTTTISFSLSKPEYAKLKVFDVLGKEIETLVKGELNSGEHSVIFNTKNLPSGVYFYRLTTPTFSQTKSMGILK